MSKLGIQFHNAPKECTQFLIQLQAIKQLVIKQQVAKQLVVKQQAIKQL